MSDDLQDRVARAIDPEAFEVHDTCLSVWERRKETALKAADAVLAYIVEAVAAEREACERVANDARTRNTVYEKARRDAAEAIRARGDTDALAARDKRVKDEAADKLAERSRRIIDGYCFTADGNDTWLEVVPVDLSVRCAELETALAEYEATKEKRD